MIKFTNSQSGFTLSFTQHHSPAYIAQSLSVHDSQSVFAASITHCLSGRRTSVGNWLAMLDAPMCPLRRYNKTDRKQTEGFQVHDLIPTRSDALIRMETAFAMAKQQNNHQLMATLLPMIRREKAKAVKSSAGHDCNAMSQSVRTVTNPRKMSKKLKVELQDERIQLETPAEIAARKAAYDQKCCVFARG